MDKRSKGPSARKVSARPASTFQPSGPNPALPSPAAAAAGLALGFTDLFGGQLAAAGLTPAQVQAQAAHQAQLMMPFFTTEMMASFFQIPQQHSTQSVHHQAQLAVAAAQAAAAASSSPSAKPPSSLLASPKAAQQSTPTTPGAHTISSAHGTPTAPSSSSGPSGPGAEKIVILEDTTNWKIGRMVQEREDDEEEGAMDVSMEDSVTSVKAGRAQDENSMTTRRSSIKRSSLRAVASKPSEPQKSPNGITKGKAAKTRLSSTLDALAAGKGAGRPSTHASSSLLQTSLLDAEASMTTQRSTPGNSSGEEETTPTRTSKRQRFTPPHLTA
jgi:hypothetical protein